MVADTAAPLEDRVVVLVSTMGDARISRQLLTEAGIASEVCSELGAVCHELEKGASALLLTDEILTQAEPYQLTDALRQQPPWSDIPVLLLASVESHPPVATWAMGRLGNVTVLERPIRVRTLVSAVRGALRARRRQYELREMLERLKDADRRKDEFLATLAHELRNPLAPIRNSIYLLRAAMPADAPPDRVHEILERQVSHMVRLVDDLLEISRITLGKVELRRERVQLEFVVRSAVETSRPLIEERRHELFLSFPAKPVPLDVDPVRIAQVVSNLLNNAAKYTQPGGQISVTARREGEEAVVSIRDNGSGIAPDMLARVFDLFVQGDGSAKRAHGGLGIGLTLARTLAQMHGGRIEAHSEGIGRGSEFVVRLPIAKADAQAEGAPHLTDRSPQRARAKTRVVVVDDNRDAADCLGLVLGHLGVDVRVVYDGRSALSVMRSHRPQAAFLDIGMPDMDGHEVAHQVREDPELRDILLIAVSGWSQDDDRRRSRDAGFDHHMVKPLDLDSQPLRELIASLGAKAET